MFFTKYDMLDFVCQILKSEKTQCVKINYKIKFVKSETVQEQKIY